MGLPWARHNSCSYDQQAVADEVVIHADVWDGAPEVCGPAVEAAAAFLAAAVPVAAVCGRR